MQAYTGGKGGKVTSVANTGRESLVVRAEVRAVEKLPRASLRQRLVQARQDFSFQLVVSIDT